MFSYFSYSLEYSLNCCLNELFNFSDYSSEIAPTNAQKLGINTKLWLNRPQDRNESRSGHSGNTWISRATFRFFLLHFHIHAHALHSEPSEVTGQLAAVNCLIPWYESSCWAISLTQELCFCLVGLVCLFVFETELISHYVVLVGLELIADPQC